MTNKQTALALIAGTLALGVSAGALYAQDGTGGANELTLDEAIAIAEAETGGTALDAEFDTEDGARVIEVEVAMANGEAELIIDPVTGAVLETEFENGEDDHDDDDEDEDEDEDENGSDSDDGDDDDGEDDDDDDEDDDD